eukprot:TRINITY_DN11744_c0_g1_i1.p1 TRINITY_DN11744_c0_g1~~TRINITY_DN11744_c0_g1_i1.p1  ORF type:complete len:136 (+),score=17.49 TRINITY_DN11744_c0_g1_i1:31-438(+)
MSYPPFPFKVVGIEDFNVAPLKKGKTYTVTAISSDGAKWETVGPFGKPGWFPAQLAKPVASGTQPRVAPTQPKTLNTPSPTQAQPRSPQPRTAEQTTQPQRSSPAQPKPQTATSPRRAPPSGDEDPFGDVEVTSW